MSHGYEYEDQRIAGNPFSTTGVQGTELRSVGLVAGVHSCRTISLVLNNTPVRQTHSNSNVEKTFLISSVSTTKCPRLGNLPRTGVFWFSVLGTWWDSPYSTVTWHRTRPVRQNTCAAEGLAHSSPHTEISMPSGPWALGVVTSSNPNYFPQSPHAQCC